MTELGMFAKYWEPGRVKTRLANSIGPHLASQLSMHFARCLSRRLSSCGDQRTISIWPPESSREFETLARDRWRVRPQSPGNLGERMRTYLQDAFARGCNKVVLIGSDSPTLDESLIDHAFELLDSYSTVLGPTDDGGYYLVAARDSVPPIFDEITWSSPSVWNQTVGRLERRGIPYGSLPTWYDVDEMDDLRRLGNELQSRFPDDLIFEELRETVELALG